MRREVLFEFIRVGNSVKVNAFDTNTLVEISIVAPHTAPVQHLKMLALKRLDYVLAKRAQK